MMKKCDRCGSEFELRSHHAPMRDQDQIDCTECGATLIRWNGSTYYSIVRLVQRGANAPIK